MSDLPEPGFESVTLVEEFDDRERFPRTGVAPFRGVAYGFRMRQPKSERSRPMYDLAPMDPEQGLPVLAEAEFRRVHVGPERSDQLEVRWTSLGSPGLATDPRI